MALAPKPGLCPRFAAAWQAWLRIRALQPTRLPARGEDVRAPCCSKVDCLSPFELSLLEAADSLAQPDTGPPQQTLAVTAITEASDKKRTAPGADLTPWSWLQPQPHEVSGSPASDQGFPHLQRKRVGLPVHSRVPPTGAPALSLMAALPWPPPSPTSIPP